MKKEIVFKAALDMSDFDQQVGRAQSRLKRLQQETSHGQTVSSTQAAGRQAGFLRTSSAQDSYTDSRSRQNLKELENFSRQQFTFSEKTLENIKRRDEQLKRLRETESSLTRGSKEQLQVQDQIVKVEEKRHRLLENYERRSKAFRDAESEIDDIDPTGSKRGLRTRLRKLSQRMGGPVGMVGAGLAGAGALAIGAGEIIRAVSAVPRQIASAQGATTQALTGEFYGSLGTGRTSDLTFFGEERQRARDRTQKEFGRATFADRLIGLGGAATLLGGLLATVATGGLAAPLIASAAAIGMVTSSGFRKRTLGTIDELTGGHMGFGDELKADQLREMAANYQQNKQAEMQKNPLKVVQRERFFQTMDRDLRIQRSLGLDDSGFHGGFLAEGAAGLFTQADQIGMSNRMLASGASTTLARSSARALQLERSMGLTNIGGVMGRLGTADTSDGAQTESTVIRMLSQGFKIGLNETDFVQETRDFIEASTNFVTSKGAFSGEAQMGLADEFAKFLGTGSRTRADISGAATAAQAMNAMFADTEGPGGALLASKLAGDSRFAGASTPTIGALLGATNLSADSPQIKRLARETKMTPRKAFEIFSQARSESVLGPLIENRLIKIRDKGGAMSDTDFEDIATEASSLFRNFQDLDSKAQRAFIQRMVTGEMTKGDRDLLAGAESQVAFRAGRGASETGRVADIQKGAQSREESLLSEEFIKAQGSAGSIRDEMAKAAKTASNMTRTMLEDYLKLQEAIKQNEREDTSKQYSDIVRQQAAPTRPPGVVK